MNETILRAARLAGENDRVSGKFRDIRFQDDELAEAYACGYGARPGSTLPRHSVAPALVADKIVEAVEVSTGVDRMQIRSRRKDAEIVRARHMAMWVIRHTTGASYATIGRILGGRDHTSVMHGVRKFPTYAQLQDTARSIADRFKREAA